MLNPEVICYRILHGEDLCPTRRVEELRTYHRMSSRDDDPGRRRDDQQESVTSFNSFSAPRDVKDGQLISFRANVEDRPKNAVGPM